MIVTIRDIERAVCQRFNITREKLVKRTTSRKASRPRMIAMYLAREMTGLSFPRLGRHFGRHHSSVLLACRQMALGITANPKLASQIESCREILGTTTLWKERVARDLAEHGVIRGMDGQAIEAGERA